MQKNVPSTVVYYYCAWYVFLQTDVTVFSHVVFVPEYFTLLNTDNRLGAIHKGRLLKGVGRWVHQKEIY